MIKLGTVPFLNVRPLVYPLEEGLIRHDFEISYLSPSELAPMLAGGGLDVALVPVAELLADSRRSRIVPGVSISSAGKVASVILLAKEGLRDIKTVAVDARSRSSTRLLRVILEIFYNAHPRYVAREPEGDFLDGVDGGMLIGNAGLRFNHFPPAGWRVYDLGEIWTEATGLPFVYAVYAAGEGINLGGNLGALVEAKRVGLGEVHKIAKIEAAKLGLPEAICREYLAERIRFDLGEPEMRGISAYAKFLLELGEIDKIPDLRIYQAQ
ncbi:MAG: menaquinone biosynthetic enzyme MqnA/MqnD family protein [Deltaproteobacteria bacterium]